MYQWEQRSGVEDEVRDSELRTLESRWRLVEGVAETLAGTSTDDERKAVLDELAEMVRGWDVNACLDNQLFDIPAWLRRQTGQHE